MKIWLDAHISPSLSNWIHDEFKIECFSFSYLGLRDANDFDIYKKAKQEEEVIIISKDSDFVTLVENRGAPPFLIWLTCGNTSNEKLKEILRNKWLKCIHLIRQGNAIVEISDYSK